MVEFPQILVSLARLSSCHVFACPLRPASPYALASAVQWALNPDHSSSSLARAIMVKTTDERFTTSDEFSMNPPASSSRLIPEPVASDSERLEAEVDSTSEQETGHEDSIDGLGDGMDVEGFSGPKIVKPLTPEVLAAFQAAQEKAGVIYITRIPPGMQPTKVRHLMSQYGEVGRVYLQKEGMTIRVLDHTQD